MCFSYGFGLKTASVFFASAADSVAAEHSKNLHVNFIDEHLKLTGKRFRQDTN